ncbi:hypothetical protein EDB80DRAFT_810956 [Ilyonectria destructans]|nr:hypothetical protein EDB80DRAFT_810956 [Ilyonectria destructans]
MAALVRKGVGWSWTECGRVVCERVCVNPWFAASLDSVLCSACKASIQRQIVQCPDQAKSGPVSSAPPASNDCRQSTCNFSNPPTGRWAMLEDVGNDDARDEDKTTRDALRPREPQEPRESRHETTTRQESPEASKRFSRYRVSRMMDGYTAAEEWLQQGAEWLAGLRLEMRMQGTKPGLVAYCSGRVCWSVSPLASLHEGWRRKLTTSQGIGYQLAPSPLKPAASGRSPASCQRAPPKHTARSDSPVRDSDPARTTPGMAPPGVGGSHLEPPGATGTRCGQLGNQARGIMGANWVGAVRSSPSHRWRRTNLGALPLRGMGAAAKYRPVFNSSSGESTSTYSRRAE